MKILQLFTSGYHVGRDGIFAYGIYDPGLGDFQIKTGEDLGSWDSQIDHLVGFLKDIQDNQTKILMFNGLGQVNFLKHPSLDVRNFYDHHVIDIYGEVKSLREIIQLPNLQLATLAREVDPTVEILPPPDIFRLWEKDPEDFNQELLENYLEAINLASHYLSQLKEGLKGEGFSIDSIDKNTFYGHTQSQDSFFVHGDYYLYTEDQGKFKLEIYPMEIAYDSKRRCTYIPVDEKFTNFAPMPDGFLLIRLDKALNIQGILDFIQFIQGVKTK